MEPSLLVVLWILVISIQLPGHWNHLPPLFCYFFFVGCNDFFLRPPPPPRGSPKDCGAWNAFLLSLSLTCVVTVQPCPGFDFFVFICIPQGGREYEVDTRVSLERSRSFERGWLAGHLGVFPLPSFIWFQLA